MLSFPGYQTVEVLDVGRDTVLLRAVREADGHRVLVRTVHADYPSARQIAPLRHEFDIARALTADGVLRPLELGERGGRVALIFDDSGGRTLRRLMNDRPIPVAEAIGVALRAALILARVHGEGVVHKDLKPVHLLVEGPRVLLTGFGIASRLERETPAAVNPDALQGTLAYMAPEQTGRMNRRVDHRTDFYALGVVLYEMLVGRLPFEADDPLELVHCHVARAPIPPHRRVPDLDPAISAVVMKLLAKTADERYQSAQGIARDLEACLRAASGGYGLQGFVPGRRDTLAVFHIPQRLYGRQREMEALRAAFERVADGATEVMLVAGRSGVGKSALLREVQRPLTHRHGYFIAGKFDAAERGTPYAALIQAGTDLVRQLLTESAERVAAWGAALREALGPNGQLVVEVIPEIAPIVGPQPPLAPLPPAESLLRTQVAFQAFIQVIARADHPLALVLDDLQWADAATLGLLAGLVTDPRTRHFLVLGAWRDNETPVGHPLHAWIEEIGRDGGTLHAVHLDALGHDDLRAMVSDALRCPPETAAPLAELVERRTGGNPLFVGQLLLALERSGMLRSDGESRQWIYDIEGIGQAGINDDVLAFLVEEVQRLPVATREALCVAACIGSRFSVRILARVRGVPPSLAAVDLWEAVRVGLIMPQGDDYQDLCRDAADDATCAFLHDRVRQAVASLVDEARGRALHLRIGRLLLEGAGDDGLFEIVGHLDEAIDLVTDPDERHRLMELNLRAARRARASAAFEAARGFLATAVGLLPDDAWETSHEPTFHAHLERAEAEYLCGEAEQAARMLDGLRRHTRTRLDHAAICILQIDVRITRNDYRGAVEAALEGIRPFGVHLPEKPGQASILTEMLRVRWAMRGRSVASLLDAPRMTDAERIAVMGILNRVLPPMYVLGYQELMTLAVLKMVRMSLKHGNTADSTFAYAVYAFVLGGGLGDYAAADAFATLALQLTERLDCPQYLGRNHFVVGMYVYAFTRPFADGTRHARDAVRFGQAYGDLNFVNWAAVFSLIVQSSTGWDPLRTTDELWEQFGGFVAWTRNPGLYHAALLYRQVARCLQGATRGPSDLSDDEVDEAASLAVLEDSALVTALAVYHTDKMRLAVIFGDVAAALRHEAAATRHEPGIVASRQWPRLFLFRALAMARAFEHAPRRERARYRRAIRTARDRFHAWSRRCPEAFRAGYYLLQAELARVQGRETEAAAAYPHAAEAAHGSGNMMLEALARELEGSFHGARGHATGARTCRRAAHFAYVRWGAAAKVAQLERQYPELAPIPAPPDALEQTLSGDVAALDLATLLRASQVLAAERALPALLRLLMKFLMENAGAQRAVLLLDRDGRLTVEAEGSVGTRQAALVAGIPLDEATSMVPAAIVRYVARTGEPLVLADAGADGRFAQDPYVTARRVRSVLCAPLAHQGRMSGVVYLENGLASDVFAPRLEVVRVLAAQAAVSIENALLYGTLEGRVAERTEQLHEKNQRLEETLAELRRTQEEVILQRTLAERERRRAEELKVARLEAAQEVLQARQEALAAFLAIASHDLRGPLTLIRRAARLIREDTPPARFLECRRSIETASRRALGLVQSYLDTVQLETDGKICVERAWFHSAQTVRDEVEFQMASLTEERRDEVVLTTRLEASQIYGDADRFRQVVANLMGHALKYAPEKPRVEVSAARCGHVFRFEVRDNGPGVAEADRERLFRPFERVIRQHSGSGLGLWIARALVEAHGGRIGVDSAPDDGSCFWFELPVPTLERYTPASSAVATDAS